MTLEKNTELEFYTSNDLWDHQKKAVNEIENLWLEGYQSICLQVPTGGGKTRILRQIVENHNESKKVIYILAHRESLVKQLSDEVTEAEIKHGIIAAGKPYIKYRVQVCSMQTLVRRLEKVDEPDLLIIDESHHTLSNSYVKIINYYPRAKILGVTATPARLSGEPMSDVFQKLILGPQVSELMDNGVLCNYDYYAPDDVDMSGAKKQGGDYKTSEAESRADNKKIIGSIVGHYKKLADHRRAIVCCVSIAHAEHIEAGFLEAGYRAKAVHSKMDGSQKAIDGLRDGSLEILIQVEMLSEGVDVKGAEVLIMARPTASTVICMQQWGRVLRSAQGKEKAIIIDHVSNFERHGLPDDFREWTLEGKIKKQESSSYKRCPKCLCPVAKSKAVCPYCGFVWGIERQPMAIPEEQEGELVNIKDRRQVKNNLILAIARQAHSIGQACQIAKKYGYKPGYGAWIWKKELKNT